MEEFKICISYGKENIDDNAAFLCCKSFIAKCPLDFIKGIYALLEQLKKSGVIVDFIIYSETLPSK